MNRTVEIRLRNVSPTPESLREQLDLDRPAETIDVNLGQLFLHYYFDSYPAGPPNLDPSSFEYLQFVSSSDDFRFHAHIAHASLTKRRGLSTDMGQAFCRLMLTDHFGMVHFAPMSEILDKPAHAAFGSLRMERICRGDVPDYLCSHDVQASLAEAREDSRRSSSIQRRLKVGDPSSCEFAS